MEGREGKGRVGKGRGRGGKGGKGNGYPPNKNLGYGTVWVRLWHRLTVDRIASRSVPRCSNSAGGYNYGIR